MPRCRCCLLASIVTAAFGGADHYEQLQRPVVDPFSPPSGQASKIPPLVIPTPYSHPPPQPGHTCPSVFDNSRILTQSGHYPKGECVSSF